MNWLRHSVLRCFVLRVYICFVIYGSLSGNGRTVADDSLRHSSPIDLLRRTVAFWVKGPDKETVQKLQSLQRDLLQGDYSQFATDVLHSGVLPNKVGQRFGGTDSNLDLEDNVVIKIYNTSTSSYNLTTASDNITTPSYSTVSSENVSISYVVSTTTLTGRSTPTTPSPEPYNQQCVKHTAFLLTALSQKQPWAIQMIDADGKPNPNLKGFHLFWVGDYEECINTVAPLSDTPASGTDNVNFRGRYCTAVLPLLPTDTHGLIPAVPPSGIRVGLCVPDSCNGIDITQLLNGVLESRNITFRVGLTTCQERTVDYDAKAIVVLIICSLFLLLLVLGTTYDLAVVHWPRWREARELGVDAHTIGSNGYNPIDNGPTSVNVKTEGETQPLLGGQQETGTSAAKGVIAKDLNLGRLGQVLLAFSVYTNGKKILTASHSPGSITCIHGIRFLSMTWVILGHTFVFSLTTAANYATYLKNSMGLWTFQAVLGAPVTVDTFFVLSGLLVTYLVLKEMDRRNGKVNWFLFYFHRFWRLTPPYALVMMVHVCLFRYLGDGPNWLQEGMEINYCRDTWWTNLLYINNFVRVKEMCLTWSWYLSNDMQFYIISPLLFLPLWRWRKVGVGLATLWLLATVLIAGVLARVNNYPPSIGVTETSNAMESADYFMDFYIKPYCRFGPYVVGMLTGYALYVTKCQMKMNPVVSLSGWAIATALGLAVVYGLYGAANGHTLTHDVAAFYNAMNHTVWGVCVAWLIFACATGNGGPINTFLSWNAFIPLSRLTYMAYLIHPVVIELYQLSSPALFYMSHLNCAMAFLSFTVASFGVAFILSLAFEAPMMGLEKVLLPKGKKH